MIIVSSTVTQEEPQADRRRWVCEQHVDEAGTVHEFRYLAERDLDVEAVMRDRALALATEPEPV